MERISTFTLEIYKNNVMCRQEALRKYELSVCSITGIEKGRVTHKNDIKHYYLSVVQEGVVVIFQQETMPEKDGYDKHDIGEWNETLRKHFDHEETHEIKVEYSGSAEKAIIHFFKNAIGITCFEPVRHLQKWTGHEINRYKMENKKIIVEIDQPNGEIKEYIISAALKKEATIQNVYKKLEAISKNINKPPRPPLPPPIDNNNTTYRPSLTPIQPSLPDEAPKLPPKKKKQGQHTTGNKASPSNINVPPRPPPLPSPRPKPPDGCPFSWKDEKLESESDDEDSQSDYVQMDDQHNKLPEDNSAIVVVCPHNSKYPSPVPCPPIVPPRKRKCPTITETVDCLLKQEFTKLITEPTLFLTPKQRSALYHHFDVNNGWEKFAIYLKLPLQDVNVVKTFSMNHRYSISDVFLYHWEATQSPVPCTMSALIKMLEEINRDDLVNICKQTD
ncbi:uncharacterized protein LOC102803267 [Saccoglossus kowalevskii]|uniref:Uncharacterized protein LOC102803267 n=1 Tax=Saccoglossus kowalevskii TaxID=10224 RepID=A0ABM0MIU6_SACKO|nr:PREDICTED: uncharacterized protein LOC102803267 [Saccoglossus kowalevskii]